MITDALLDVIMAVPLMLVSVLPSVDMSIPSGVFDWIYDIANAVGYLLPIKSLLTILSLSLSITGFQIAWALLLRIKSFIPTMGA